MGSEIHLPKLFHGPKAPGVEYAAFFGFLSPSEIKILNAFTPAPADEQTAVSQIRR
jgi:hypothetical protein